MAARCIRLLLTDDPASATLTPSALVYRARYRYDPQFRAREINRRHERDYTVDSDGTLTPSVIQRLFAETRECPYCERPLHPRDKTLDHVIPRVRGGTHSITNVVVCCLSCNSKKHDMTPERWADALQRIRRDIARRAERAA